MSFVAQPHHDTVVLRIGKTLDFANAIDFRTTCRKCVAGGGRFFILDFSETGIIDSTGLGAIFSLHRQITPLAGEVVFAAISAPVRVVLQVSRVYKIFPQYATVESACDAFDPLNR